MSFITSVVLSFEGTKVSSSRLEFLPGVVKLLARRSSGKH